MTLMRRRTALASLILVAGILSCFILGRIFVLDRVTIRGRSMEPFFHEGDKVWISKIALCTRGVKAGDAVIYHHPAKDYFVCKRCIAAPGDSVRYAQSAADTTLYSGIGYAPAKGDTVVLDSVNFCRYAHAIAFETGGEPVWIEGAAFLDGKLLEHYRFTRDWYYFLGDNRNHSVDSRHYGLIPKDKLLGVVRGSW